MSDHRRSDVTAGEVYSAAARLGRRRVRIEQVRGLSDDGQQPYVLVREILPSGKEAKGWLHGVPREGLFNIALTWDRERRLYRMPGYYSLEYEAPKMKEEEK